MIDIDKMTTNEWIEYRRDKLDAYYAAGKELKPSPECKYCDAHNDYVCFACELDQTGE
jgi:hypothetical protein